MKYIVIAFLLISIQSFSQGPNTSIISVPYDAAGHTRFALLTLPDDYSSTNTSYPLIGFGHGVGELGDGTTGALSRVYTSAQSGGPAYFIAQGKWPSYFINPSDGKQYKFIVLTPQYKNGSTTGGQANGSTTSYEWDAILTYMYKAYRVDTNRVYLTGLSAGGAGIVDLATHYMYNTIHHPAAIAPMSAEIGTPSQIMENNIISDSTHVWGFGSEGDTYGITTHEIIIGGYNGNGGSLKGIGYLGKWTGYAGGHCCWGQFYNPSFGLYNWFLQFSRGKSSPPVVVPPICPVCPPPIVCPVCPPMPKQRSVAGWDFTKQGTAISVTFTYDDGTIQVIQIAP